MKEVKIEKILEFARCGIYHNFPTGENHDKYMQDLDEFRELCQEFLDHSEDTLEKVEKSCEHDWFYAQLLVNPPIDKRYCRICGLVEYKDYSGEYREPNYTPKQQDKYKKLKYVYVCKECLGSEPCKLKVYGSTAHPNTCPLEKSRKAKWKLKKEV